MSHTSSKYYKRWFIVLAPLTGLIITLIFYDNSGNQRSASLLVGIFQSIAITVGLWVGCLNIVGYLWVKFPWEKYPVKHLILEFILITAYTILLSGGIYFLEVYFGFIEPADNIKSSIAITLLITYLITLVHEAIDFYRQWKLNFSKSVKLERDNIEAKYETLKQQINPHFLFNSLNSLANMVEDNKDASAYVQNLSEFLRYILKSRDVELILLREEVHILNKYIALQKSRFGNKLQVEMDIPERFFHYAIPPLVLQMLLENAIKHNIISSKKPLSVSIRASKEQVTISNILQKKTNYNSTGNGLKNIKDRYQFFTANQVVIKEINHNFTVTVPLLIHNL